MNSIQRHILSELFITALVALVAVNFVLMTEKVFRMTIMLVYVGADMADILRLIVYLQPQIMIITVPMALMVSILVTYGRMNAESEVVVLRTSGMSFGALAAPAFVLGALCFGIGLVNSFALSPWGVREMSQRVTEILSSRAEYAIEPGVFSTTFKDMVLYVEGRSEGSGTFRGLFIHDGRDPARPLVLYAEEARTLGSDGASIGFELYNGSIEQVRGADVTHLAFDRYEISFPLLVTDRTYRHNKFNIMSPAELWVASSLAAPGRDRGQILVEFHRRMTLPVVCLLIMVFSVPLSLRAGRAGGFGGVALGLFVFAAYYGLMIYFEGLVVSGALPHYAAWAPACILGALALRLYRREARR
jgi:lipopolysaccharide export system permease protein